MAGVAAVVAVFYFNNPAGVIEVAERANPGLLVLAVGLEIFSMLLFGAAWHELLRALSLFPKPSDSIKASLLSIFGDITIPSASISGEFMRVAYARNKMSIPTHKAIASVTVHRFLYMVSFILLLLAGFVTLGISPGPLETLYAIISVIGLILLGLTMVAPEMMITKIRKVLNVLPVAEGIREKAADSMENIAIGLAEIRGSRGNMVTAFAAMLAQWMGGAAGQMAVFYSLGYSISYSLVLAVYPVYVMLTVSSVGIPGSIGVVETGMSLAYIAVGVPRAIAVAAVLLSRALVLSTDLTITFAIFLRESRHIRPTKLEEIRSFEDHVSTQ